MNPLDWSGPEFLELWLVGAVVVAVLALCLRYALAGWGAPDAELARLAKQLGPTEIAYLARGRRHAIETAVAGLLHGGAVERNGVGFVITQRGRTLLVSPDAQECARTLAPLEALALSRAADSASSLEGVALSAEEVERAMRRRLRELGVLWGSSRSTWLWTLMPALVWIALGITKLGVGVARGRPVGWLVVLLVAAGGALILVRPPRASRRGEGVLRYLESTSYGLVSTASTAVAQLSDAEYALAYALAGSEVALAAMIPMLTGRLPGMMHPAVGGCESGCASDIATSGHDGGHSCGGGSAG